MIKSITNDLMETLNYLQSEERKSSIDNIRRNQDQILINEINKTINGMISKMGTSLNISSINDVKLYISMLNKALNKSNK